MKTFAPKSGKSKNQKTAEKPPRGNFTTRRPARPPEKLKSKPKDDSPECRTIRDDENLSTEDFMKRLRIGYPKFREMIENGLPVRMVGRYRRISGFEFNRWAETQPLVNPVAVAANKKNSADPKDSAVRA